MPECGQVVEGRCQCFHWSTVWLLEKYFYYSSLLLFVSKMGIVIYSFFTGLMLSSCYLQNALNSLEVSRYSFRGGTVSVLHMLAIIAE